MDHKRISRCLITLAIVVAASGIGCSHAEPETSHAHRSTTAGDERRAEASRTEAQTAEDETQPERTVAATDAPTALDQGESADDLEITRQIRAAVFADSALSFGARNCTIITRAAVVTLRGDVGSNAERDAIDRHAHEAAGVRQVDDLLAVTH